MTPPQPVVTTGSSSAGLLQEFRKKIVKYATPSSPTTPVASPRATSPPPPTTESTGTNSRRGLLLLPPRAAKAGRPGADLTHRIGRFEEHDALLQQLELQLGDMLAQLNAACRAMGGVVEVFTQTFRYDAASYRVGVDYLAAMKQMRRERAHLMEQAMRFTVLDPIASRLARHAALQERIAEWRQLQRDVDREEHKKWSDTAARDARLAVLHSQLDEVERELGEALDMATDATAVRQQVELFTTMRLQLATFFFHTNHSLFSRLSETEAEIVIGVGPSPRSPVAGAIATTTRSVKAPTPAQEEEGEDLVSPEDDDAGAETLSSRDSKTTLTASGASEEPDSDKTDELRGSITLEEFERGKPIPLSPKAAFSGQEARRHDAAKQVPLPELLALASHPVVDTLRQEEDDDSDSDAARSRRRVAKHTRSASGGESSVFSALRKTFHDKFNSPRGSERGFSGASPPASPTAATTEKQQQQQQQLPPVRRRVVLTAREWRDVEARLWRMDYTPPNAADAATHATETTLPGALQREPVLFALSGFLCLASVARLSKTSRGVHRRLRACAAAWKRSIRLGGLSRATRSAVWLSILYGGAPWLATADAPCSLVPHHLQSRALRKQIYESLLVKLGARIADGLLQKSFDEDAEDGDTARLVVWLREIDVDVVRTCSRAIYARQSAAATPAEALGSYRSLLEGTIRRVLRAYVVYNPRVGYCQGMNFLVRLLMEVCCGEADEADCFWLFVGLCEPETDRNLYEPGLAVLQPLFARFDESLARHKPRLHAHFASEGVPVAAYTARWFLTFYSACETFDASVVIRVLDAFAIDGWRVIFGMALVVLDELEPQLLESEMEEMLRVLQSPRDRLSDRDWTEQLVRRGLAYSVPE